MNNGNDDAGYVAKTLRSAALWTILVALLLASYGQFWAISPLVCGVALAGVLLYGWDQFVRGVFSPEAVRRAREKGRDRRWALVAFALIKYPLVGLLLWAVVRAWHGDPRRIMAFVGGVILLHLVIALRAAGRLLVKRNKE